MGIDELCTSPKQAQEILDTIATNPDTPKSIIEYYNAIIDGTLPQYYYKKILYCQSFSDDLPKNRLATEWHPDYPNLKCRINKIIVIGFTVLDIIDYELIEKTEQIETFLNHKWNGSRGGKGEYWTLPEEIDLINQTLNYIKQAMEEKYGFS